jgi:hypothetical protein
VTKGKALGAADGRTTPKAGVVAPIAQKRVHMGRYAGIA